MRRKCRAGLIASMLSALLLLSGYKQQNRYVAPPPADVGMATPLGKNVTLHLELTGNTVALDQVNLVAKVPGFLREINY